MSSLRSTSGFTIVELLIVIVVIAILAAITIVGYNGVTSRARDVALQSDLRNASTQLELGKLDTGSYPSTGDAELKGSGDNKLEYTSPYGTDNGYCVTASRGDASYYLASVDGQIKEGKCTGHSGDAPVAVTCDAGFIKVPGSATFGTTDFCVMKYEAKNVGGFARSQAAGSPWVSVSQTTALSESQASCSGCHLISEAEWMTIAANVLSVPSNWSGGSIGSGYIYSGHHDNSPSNALSATSNDSDGYNGTGNTSGNQRRTLTLTNGEVIWDLAGNVWEWTSGVTTGGQPGISGEACYSWKEWTAVNVAGSLSPSPRPAGAGSWNSAQGIGKLYSCSSEAAAQRGFVRGGDWSEVASTDSSDTAGVLALALGSSPSYITNAYGFRVAK